MEKGRKLEKNSLGIEIHRASVSRDSPRNHCTVIKTSFDFFVEFLLCARTRARGTISTVIIQHYLTKIAIRYDIDVSAGRAGTRVSEHAEQMK